MDHEAVNAVSFKISDLPEKFSLIQLVVPKPERHHRKFARWNNGSLGHDGNDTGCETAVDARTPPQEYSDPLPPTSYPLSFKPSPYPSS
jgi:hypothetical protein